MDKPSTTPVCSEDLLQPSQPCPLVAPANFQKGRDFVGLQLSDDADDVTHLSLRLVSSVSQSTLSFNMHAFLNH